MTEMLHPLISVVIPTYNRAHIIEKSVRSVCAQTYQNIEILIVDDGSTDNTKDIILAIHDQRIRYLVTPANKGPSFARNFGIQKAYGEFIAFHDSDDICYPNKLQTLLNHYVDDGCKAGIVWHPYSLYVPGKEVKTVPNTKILEELSSENCNIFSHLLKMPLIGTPTMMIPKKILEEVGGFTENLHSLEDYELSIKIASKYPILLVNEILLDVEQSFDGVNNNIEGRIKSIFYILQEFDIPYKTHNLARLRAIQHNFYESNFLITNISNDTKETLFIHELQNYLKTTERNFSDKISIILPCHNIAKKVDLYLNSIFSQSIGLSSLEIILINNASTDSTGSILEQYEQLYPDQTILIHLDEKETIPTTMNIGMQYVSGKYLYFMEPTSILDVVAIEVMYSLCEKNRSDIVDCNYTLRTKNYDFHPLISSEAHLLNADFPHFRNNLLTEFNKSNPWNKLYRTDFVKENQLHFLDNLDYENIYFNGMSILLCRSYCNTTFILYEFEEVPNISSTSELEIFIKNAFYSANSLINELSQRNITNNDAKSFSNELEYYVLKRVYYDPLQVVLQLDDQQKKENLCLYLILETLKLLPNAASNPIMEQKNLPHWDIYKKFLLTCSVT